MAELASIDFRKRNKDWISVTMGEGEDEITIRVLPPTKRIHAGLVELGGYIDAAEEGKLDYETFDMSECLELVAQSLSHNKEKRVITVDYLERIDFDLADVGDFIGAYLFFIMESAKGKN